MHRSLVVLSRLNRVASNFPASSSSSTLAFQRLASRQLSNRFFSGCGDGGEGGGCGGGQQEQKEKFPMPDRDEEMKLARIQSTITEHYKRGDFTKALEGSEDLLKQTVKHFGMQHPATASAYNNVGLMQKLLGDFVEARQNYNQAMRIYAKVVGRDHASYAMTLHNLATLNKSQVHFDTTLKAIDRLSLVETALEYFEEAMAIRKVELGEEHPHTVATKSSYGSTLAAQVLHQHRHVEGGKTGDNQKRRVQYVSLNPHAVTEQGWQVAEEHLREALHTAVSNPRGKSIRKGKGENTKSSNTGNTIDTLSAAAAAQNLAVFLKSRALTEDPYNAEMMDEAKSLYMDVQKVRSQLLPSQHPDLYATKYSLAELLDVAGDEEAANVLREEILETYDPDATDLTEPDTTTRDGEENISEPPRVVVEKTKASKS